jgi:uncharacterized membrane protein YdjX (TVP38/TMEM64 family)
VYIPVPFFLLLLLLPNQQIAPFIIGSTVGAIPAVILFTYIGSVARNIHEIAQGKGTAAHGVDLFLWILWGVVIVGVVVFITFRARKEYNKEMEDAEKGEV